VAEAAAALGSLVRTVASTLHSAGPLVCAGGLLTHQPMLLQQLRAELAPSGVTDIRLLDIEPVHGALHLASRAARPAPTTVPA
jgi:hypothetical protein